MSFLSESFSHYQNLWEIAHCFISWLDLVTFFVELKQSKPWQVLVMLRKLSVELETQKRMMVLVSKVRGK